MHHVSSRAVFRAGVFGVAATVTLGFPVGPAGAFEEAPQLADRVEAGDLPPVDERLPEEPLTVEPIETIGTYGGVWRSALLGGSDSAWLARTVGYEGLVRYDRDWTSVVPDVAKDWEINEDATRFTFHLRPGMKWSDGEPFTAEDVAYAFELSQNTAYPGEVPAFIRDPQNPPHASAEDDETVVFTFDKPNGLFMQQLSMVDGPNAILFPKMP
ncbi:ABC transporter substrate-binding protein [Consotaella aegiceratis]|uniref:ABC transporter substrate-binding protein n=1 Tax=Consotaella aegiceratis TaxID=3097961 RepID=UPI002F402923